MYWYFLTTIQFEREVTKLPAITKKNKQNTYVRIMRSQSIDTKVITELKLTLRIAKQTADTKVNTTLNE